MFNLEDIARVAHEANRAVQVITGDEAVSPAWGDAPEWQRSSAMEGVEKALRGAGPQQMHESWCEFKRNDGWVYGEVKDAEAKTHPCLTEYANLPPEQKVKDELFLAVVFSLASDELLAEYGFDGFSAEPSVVGL